MTNPTSGRAVRLLAGASLALMIMAAAQTACAAGAPPQSMTGVGAEGTDVAEVVVTANRNQASADAPTKAIVEEMQPESVIDRKFIEQVTPRVGDWTTVANIAPSVSGITSNGGGVGDYNKLTLRGFQDGQFNVTYDGIAFGDTNDPTHHNADYFPASTIGAVVIDRGPGAAGDLGQANFGGAFHFFSPEPTKTFGASQSVTYGSYNTIAGNTTINTGEMPQLGGGRLLVNVEARQSDGELSHSGGYAVNALGKFVMPVGDKATLTLFSSFEETRFNLADAGPGATWRQIQLYGKNFALTAIPNDEHNYNFNYEYKDTDFEYIDLKGELAPSITAENQLYTYFYKNATTAANDISGLIGGANTSPPNITAAPESANDIGGYDKLNEYRVVGDIFRLNKTWSFGTLKVGGLVEHSTTDRHNIFVDLSLNGYPDNKFHPPAYPFTTNAKLSEHSNWLQEQAFADFSWTPTDNLTIQPGFKYVHFVRNVNAEDENTAGGSKNQGLVASNTYEKPLYFVTGNYRIRRDWSVYAQAASSFLIPSLSFLYATGANVQSLQPETAVSYQTGTVYTHGKITLDADVYRVDVSNLVVACNIPNPTAANAAGTAAGFCNIGSGRYSGVEGEAAYAFDFGLTVFANGSENSAKTAAVAANPGAGIAAAPAGTVPNAPKWTYALGGIYHRGPLAASLVYKNSGAYVAGYTASHQALNLPGYDSLDASASYDFGRVRLLLQAFNLADKRAITSFSGQTLYSNTDTGSYTLQAGRTLMGTVIAKF